MTNYAQMERRLTDVLGLSRRPVAIAFRDTPPEGVLPLSGTQPSGCSFWRLAAGGQVFYTVPSDHFNCSVGCYTHNIALPPEREADLTSTLGLMVDIGYIKLDEVPGVTRLPKTPAATIYAPLSQTPVAPDAVVVAGKPAKLMLLHESAIRAAKSVLPLLGRPTCMAIPAALSGGVASSLGCIGNRVYTGLDEDELYVALPGRDLPQIAGELATITAANARLADYHARRRGELATECGDGPELR
jgi:uncharacterized protein (DUF169 family)